MFSLSSHPSSYLYAIGGSYITGASTVLGLGAGLAVGVRLSFCLLGFFNSKKENHTSFSNKTVFIVSLGTGSVLGLGGAALAYKISSQYFFSPRG